LLAVAVTMAGLMACTTTVRLGPAGDPGTVRAIDELAAQPDAYARVAEPSPPVQAIYSVHAPSPIVGHEPGWLTLSKPGGPVRVPLTQVRSVSTYAHARGALDGAVVLGAVGFVLGFAGGSLLIPQTCNDDGFCDTSIPVATRLHWGAVVGAVFGAMTAALGAGVGAVQGHETRNEITSP
jgi:hypothetical protein